MITYESLEIFECLISTLLPNGGAVAVIGEVYLDESGTHDDANVLCMGGYMFLNGNAQKFNQEMIPVYRRFHIPYFHSSEICGGIHKPGGSGVFDHLTAAQRDKLARIFINTIKRRSAFGFAATINERDYDRLIGLYGTMPRAYGFLLYQCFIHIRRWIEKTGFVGRVAYFLEDGGKNKGDAITYLYDRVLSGNERRERYNFSGFSLLEKTSCPAINSPDFLAYRWAHYHENLLKGISRPRRDLEAVLRPQDVVSDWANSNVNELEALVRRDFAASLPLVYNPEFGR